MTVIEISSPPDPNSQQKSQEGEGPPKSDRAVGGDQPVASSSKGALKKVSFSKTDGRIAIPIAPEESNNVEQDCLERARGMFDRDLNEALFRRILKSTWNYQDAKSAEELMPQLIDKYFDELSRKNTANSASNSIQTIPEGPVTIDNEPPHLLPAYPGPIGPMSAADKEDKDLYKAIENSLKQDVPPLEKLRGDVSVGLENVGQTCWFGVIAQVLFHIPKYRKTIYENTPPEWVEMSKNQPNGNFTERDLLVRMRTLFAEMDAGNRKSVDPKPVLDVIEELVKTKQPQNQLTKIIGTQQDASELLEYISDWVEKGLQFAHHEIHTKYPLEISTAPPPPHAPEAMISVSSEQMECAEMAPLEDDKMVVDPPQEEHVFAVPELPDRVLPPIDGKRTALDAWADSPLKDVFHGTSLTRSMNADSDCAPNRVSTSMPIFRADISQRDIHDALANHGFSDKSETWFENLPGVLILTLNRVAYDKGISKIHTVFDVPPKLYMDRYLYRNMSVVKEIQERKADLKSRLRAVSAQLKGYTNYPVAEGEANLKNVLQAARLFLSGEAEVFSTGDRELPVPCAISEEDRVRFLQLFDQLGQNCSSEENEFRRQRDELLEEISQLFERSDLHQEEYILHAVVIHEGEANLGHYYTCIRGGPMPENREVWQKFNDRNVDIVSWEQIQLEAGGRYKTGSSAYCLVYVRASDMALHSDAYVPFRQRMEILPHDLVESVSAKNMELCDDINRYDEAMQVTVAPAPLQKADTWLYDEYDAVKVPLHMPAYNAGLLQYVAESYRRAYGLIEESANYRRKDMSFEGDMKHTLIMTGACHLKGYLSRKFPEFKDYKTIQEAVVQLQLSAEEQKNIYNLVIFEWPIFHYAKESKDDVRADVLSFWRATGIGLPALVFRYIVVKALSMSRSLYAPHPSHDSPPSDEYKFLEVQAIQELSQVPAGQQQAHNTSWDYYYAYFLRIMGNYSLVKGLWGLIKVVLHELYTAKGIKFDVNSANDYVDAWMKPLRQSFRTLRIYYVVKEDLEQQAASMGFCIDPDICIMEQSLVRGTLLYSFLKLFDFVANVLVKCREQRNEAQGLMDSQMFNHICAALNQISKWSKEGCEMSQKVVASVTECLNCAGDVLKEAGGPALTVIKNLYHAIDPNTALSVTPCAGTVIVLSMENEIIDVKNVRLELGLSDDQDAMCTVARMLEDISAAISRFFQ